MKNNKITKQLPELLEEIVLHPDCPVWLRKGIYDVFTKQEKKAILTASFWRWRFESIELKNRTQSEDILDSEVVE